MMPGLDPSKMKAMMKQMGIKQEEIPANRVIIEKDGENIIIENPGVVKINMQGNISWQITGDESVDEGFSKEDIKIVMEKTDKTEEEVMDSLQKTKDMAESILELSSE